MEQYIDFAKIRQEFSDDLIIEWDDTKLIGQNILHLFDEYFSLPCAHIQLPLLAAYWSLPSTLCSVVPILFLDGTEGSGKSNISKIFANTHGVQPYSVATTYASLRNDIDTYRFKDAEHPNGYTVKQEKNFCLVFDNLNRETLSNENLLSLFLSGYDRQTANISISIEVGKNKQFNAFCPKVVSSVHNLLDEKRFRELKRRCIRIATKKADVLTEADMPNRIGLPPRSMEMVNFLWLKNHFTKFWMTYENIRCFGKVVKQVVGTSLKVPANRKVVYIDLIASGVVAGVWASIADAAEVILEYENTLLKLFQTKSSLGIVLEGFLEKVVRMGHDSVEPQLLKGYLATAIAEGQLDAQPSFKTVEEEMFNLGWKRTRKALGSWHWTKI
ncbi:MAG TPA: hypothetical protein DCE56_06570 [Cyanobacteria bacterium UBA8553]|nr:hypothetical protein [Cyanobacteria bacterium UBA8553]HAJ59300.1 hypothetical protein [Cyanobacteria bacterium UBA8543]